jgi:hypothetical protein
LADRLHGDNVGMSFFDQPSMMPPGFAPSEEPHREPWTGTSSDTIGVVVPLVCLLARTEEVAVLVSGLVAYPTGFTFNVVSIGRLNPEPGVSSMSMGFPHELVGDRHEDVIRIGLRLADGSKVIAMGFPGLGGRGDLQAPALQIRGGGGGGRKFTQSFTCEPLPPPGPLAFVCEWPRYQIGVTEHEIDAEVILAAARQAVPIWPDDVDLQEADTE